MADAGLDRLLDLHGMAFELDPDGFSVRFVAVVVPASPERPHGLNYSLTLHGPDGERILGFDNAHPVPPRRRGDRQDHRHLAGKARVYEYRDAETLLMDFWAEVDTFLKSRKRRT